MVCVRTANRIFLFSIIVFGSLCNLSPIGINLLRTFCILFHARQPCQPCSRTWILNCVSLPLLHLGGAGTSQPAWTPRGHGHQKRGKWRQTALHGAGLQLPGGNVIRLSLGNTLFCWLGNVYEEYRQRQVIWKKRKISYQVLWLNWLWSRSSPCPRARYGEYYSTQNSTIYELLQ